MKKLAWIFMVAVAVSLVASDFAEARILRRIAQRIFSPFRGGCTNCGCSQSSAGQVTMVSQDGRVVTGSYFGGGAVYYQNCANGSCSAPGAASNCPGGVCPVPNAFPMGLLPAQPLGVLPK